jgi:uncharacterized protein
MRRRILRFALTLLVLSLLATGAVIGTWLHFVGREGPDWVWWALPAVLSASFIPATLLGFRISHPSLRILTLASAISIGFLSFGLLAAALSWIAAGAAHAAGLAVRMQLLAECIYAAAFAVALYGLLNSVIPRTVRVAIDLPHLPAYWHGRTVALVSDVHLGNIRGRLFVRHLVWRLRRRSPEAVFISGDMFDGTRIDVERAASPWRGLRPSSGVYFVSGNHDERGKRNVYAAALERTGIRVLNNEKVVARGLQVMGVHDAETHDRDLYAKILRQAAIDPDCASILLAHQPINLDIAEAAGVSLQLSGHTHGGQFWPWSLMARRVHGRFVYGLNPHRRMLVYTSSGAGTWGPPFRVGTRSEIVFLTFQPK